MVGLWFSSSLSRSQRLVARRASVGVAGSCAWGFSFLSGFLWRTVELPQQASVAGPLPISVSIYFAIQNPAPVDLINFSHTPPNSLAVVWERPHRPRNNWG